jgi:hypothetical protein
MHNINTGWQGELDKMKVTGLVHDCEGGGNNHLES